MAASSYTAAKISALLLKYVPPDKLPACVEELSLIDGNVSFRETVLRVKRQLETRRRAMIIASRVTEKDKSND